MDSPRLTVLITLYNKGAYIVEALDSVLNGSYRDLEVLVVDDGSTDDGPSRVERYDDTRLRFLRSRVNTGRAAAANRGYDAARGDFVAVLDADDVAHPDRFSKQVAFMDAHPAVAACGSWIDYWGESGGVLRMPENDADARANSLFGMPVIYGGCMLRRTTIEEHGVRCDPDWRSPGMDRLFMLKVGRHGLYANLQEPLTRYRTGTQNMRHGRDARTDMEHLVKAVFAFFSLPLTREETSLQLMFHEMDDEPLSAARIFAFHRWQRQLERRVAAKQLFDPTAFRVRIDLAWQRLFVRTSAKDLGGALMHTLLSGKLLSRSAVRCVHMALQRKGLLPVPVISGTP